MLFLYTQRASRKKVLEVDECTTQTKVKSDTLRVFKWKREKVEFVSQEAQGSLVHGSSRDSLNMDIMLIPP